MAIGKCEQCGVEEYMPFHCKFCQGRFCVSHRLPESHDCSGLGAYREKLRQEGRVMHHPEDEELVRPQVRRGAVFGAQLDRFFERASGRMHVYLIVAMVGTMLLELMVLSFAPGLFDPLFVLSGDFIFRPWTLVTSMFAHEPSFVGFIPFPHLLFNALVLFFFGRTLERFIGTRRFTFLFFAGGITAGLAQVVIVNWLLGSPAGAYGASGAVMAVAGTLTWLAPNLTILLWGIIPMPLWLLTAIFALYDTGGALMNLLTMQGDIAHIAHLGGLGLGLWYGKRLKDQGVRLTGLAFSGAQSSGSRHGRRW